MGAKSKILLLLCLTVESFAVILHYQDIPKTLPLSYFTSVVDFYERPCRYARYYLDFRALRSKVDAIHDQADPDRSMYDSMNQSYVAKDLGFNATNMTVDQHVLVVMFATELTLFRIRNHLSNNMCSDLPYLKSGSTLPQDLKSLLHRVQRAFRTYLCFNKNTLQLNSFESLKEVEVNTHMGCSVTQDADRQTLNYVAFVLDLILKGTDREERDQ